jgi:hypothetical protein
MGGYAYSYADPVSSICLRTDSLCTSGMTGISTSPSTDYGAGIGFNVNQGMTACGGPAAAINAMPVPTSAGLSYSVSNKPAGGMRITIGNFDSTTNTGTDYCAVVSGTSGTIPWSSFNSTCWAPTTTGVFPGAGASITHIEFQILPSTTATETFNFCVDSVGFSGSASTGCSTTAGQACSSSCCTPSAGPTSSNGNGELTCYTFAQMGSAPISANTYKSFCGYTITETSGGGGGGGACQSGQLNYTDTVQANIGTQSDYFVAFPTGSSTWGAGAYCGMCVNISYNGTTKMATVVDECPTGSCTSNAGHLDLSAQLARDLGVGTGGTGDPTSGVTWKPVECPVTGNIKAVWNSVAGGQVYFQNVVWPVKSVTGGNCPSGGCTQSMGIWSGVTQGQTYTLTDMLGHTVQATMTAPAAGSSVSDTCVQFPASCN